MKRNSPLRRLALAAVGVSEQRADKHSSEGVDLAAAIGYSLLFVTFSIAWLGMALFAFANFIPADWPVVSQWVAANAAGLLWASMIVLGIDRLTLLAAEALGDSPWTGLALWLVRLTLVAATSSLVSDEIVLWFWRAPIIESQRVMTNDARHAADRQISEHHNLDGKAKGLDKLEIETARLEDEGKTLPEAIKDLYDEKDKCQASARRMLDNLRHLQAGEIVDDAAVLAQRQRLGGKQRECKRLRQEADTARDEWRQQLDESLLSARTAKEEAKKQLKNAATEAELESGSQAASISRSMNDASNREIAFSRLKALHPDMATKALVVWFVLMVLEVAPLLIKSLARNNPVFLGIRTALAEECAEMRMQALYNRAREDGFRDVVAAGEIRQILRQDAVNLARAQSPLAEFEGYCKTLDAGASAARTTADRHPDLAGSIVAAYLRAAGTGFERLAMSSEV